MQPSVAEPIAQVEQVVKRLSLNVDALLNSLVIGPHGFLQIIRFAALLNATYIVALSWTRVLDLRKLESGRQPSS